MANASWNAIDAERIAAQDYYCAFIDILGYKDKAQRFFDGSFNLAGRFQRALGTATETMKLTRYFVGSEALRVSFFSDSIIILLPRSDETNSQLYSLIHFCAILSAHLSYEDLFVRGGIAFGSHLERKDAHSSFLASIALQKAYDLEHKQAKNPRILIHPDLAVLLNANERLNVAIEGNDYFVHFAIQLINRDGQNEHEVLSEMRDIRKAQQAADDQGVIDKYDWIINYYYWTLESFGKFDMKVFEEFRPRGELRFSLITSD